MIKWYWKMRIVELTFYVLVMAFGLFLLWGINTMTLENCDKADCDFFYTFISCIGLLFAFSGFFFLICQYKNGTTYYNIQQFQLDPKSKMYVDCIKFRTYENGSCVVEYKGYGGQIVKHYNSFYRNMFEKRGYVQVRFDFYRTKELKTFYFIDY